jgi:hypothetical protein
MSFSLCPSVLLRVAQCKLLIISYTENHREDTENHRDKWPVYFNLNSTDTCI